MPAVDNLVDEGSDEVAPENAFESIDARFLRGIEFVEKKRLLFGGRRTAPLGCESFQLRIHGPTPTLGEAIGMESNATCELFLPERG